MAVTTQKVRSPKNAPETIVDRSPKTPFVSPLQLFIETNCKLCENWTGKCRLDDKHGIDRMNLCISLYVGQTIPADALKALQAIPTMPEQNLTSQEVEVHGKP